MLSEPQLLQLIQAHLADGYSPPKDLSVFLNQAINAFSGARPEFEKAIIALQLHRDARAQITSYRSDHDSIWFRDARQVDLNVHSVSAWENYAILGLSYIATLHLLIEMHLPKNSEPELQRVQSTATLFMQQWVLNEKNRLLSAKECTAALLKHVIKLTQEILKVSEDVARKHIEVGKDFVNMRNTPVTIITLTKRPSLQKVTAEIELPLVTRSQALSDEYRNCRNKTWFLTLPVWQQELVLFATDSILSGKMIPTQLRKYVPGPRNAYKRVVMIITPTEAYTLLSFYHNGTPGHLFKDEVESARVTKLSIDALYESIGCQHLHMNTVLSTVRSKEATVNRQIVAGIDNLFIHHANTPVNDFRKILTNDVQQIQNTCEALGKSRARPEEAAWFMCIKTILQQTMNSRLVNDDENRNLLIQSLFLYMLSLLNDPLERACIISCLSGKDRTGVLILYATGLVMTLNEFRRHEDPRINPLRNPDVDYKLLVTEVLILLRSKSFNQSLSSHLLQLASGGHVVHLPGAPGGTPGCDGIKSESESAVPKSVLPMLKPFLFGPCARFNTKGPSVMSNPLRLAAGKDPFHLFALLTRSDQNDDDDNDNEVEEEFCDHKTEQTVPFK